jgi:hypothetical protein
MVSVADWTIPAGWDVSVTTLGVATKVAGEANNLQNTAAAASVIGRWYLGTADISPSAGAFLLNVGGTAGPPVSAPGSVLNIIRATTTAKPYVRATGALSAGTVDNLSFQPLLTDQLIAYRNYGRQVSIASALTIIANIPVGVVSRLSVNGDGTFNYVHCWHDGTNLHLDTVVNSLTVVSKVNAAAAYGAGRIIKINFSAANTAQAFYNGVQIGADQDISAVPLGTQAGLWLPWTGSSLSDPVYS